MIFALGSTAGVQVKARPPRRSRVSETQKVMLARFVLYWHGLREAGVSVRQIARLARVSVGMVHKYTQPDQVDAARRRLLDAVAEAR
jgi:hypothetical protein